MLVGDVQQRHTEDRAVGRDQRQVDAEHLMQYRARFLDDHLGHLHDRCDGDDEGQRAQILQAERHEQVVVDDVAGTRGDREHEGRRGAHAESGFQLLGDAHERAQAEDLHQHDVVDEHSADDDEQVVGHGWLGKSGQGFRTVREGCKG